MRLTSTEFAYWLQGSIEIGELNTFTEDQIAVIKQKLEEVERDNAFTFMLKVLLDRLKYNQVFDTINTELQSMFIHDIDPSYEGDQAQFNKIHAGE